jgi:hypothetical protein
MPNPLKFFIELISGDSLAFIRYDFTQNPSYNSENDTIFALGNDPFSKQEVEYRLSFSNHLKQLLSQQRKESIKLLDANLHSIISTTSRADYIQAVVDELNFLITKISQRPGSTSETITNELNELLNYITERYLSSASINQSEKLKWHGSAALFFILFQELYANELVSNTHNKRSLLRVASILYNAFDVKPNGKEKYTESAFYQHLKSTSLLQEDPSNEAVKHLVQEFVASLKALK